MNNHVNLIVSFRPLTGIMIFKVRFLQMKKSIRISFRPLTGIMIFKTKNNYQFDFILGTESFRPLTGIMIFNLPLNNGLFPGLI